MSVNPDARERQVRTLFWKRSDREMIRLTDALLFGNTDKACARRAEAVYR
jgi:hypothetical protein